MIKDWRDSVLFNGDTIKKALQSSISDGDLYAMARANPSRYAVSDSSGRPNMFKLRDDAEIDFDVQISPHDSWLREIINTWCDMSGLERSDATFWQEAGFKKAAKLGHSFQIRRYLDDSGWAWVVVRDTHGDWLNRKRLQERDRALLVNKKPSF